MSRRYRLLLPLAVGVLGIALVTLSSLQAVQPLTSPPVPATSLTAVLKALYPTATPEPTELPAGDPAPLFTLTGLDGKMYSLRAYRGKHVLLNFWASWCVPCRVEMPLLEQNLRQNKNVVVLAVNNGENTAVVRQFVEQLGLTFPVLLDRDAVVVRAYGITALPTSYFIDPSGVIALRVLGALTTEDLQSYSEQIATLAALEQQQKAK